MHRVIISRRFYNPCRKWIEYDFMMPIILLLFIVNVSALKAEECQSNLLGVEMNHTPPIPALQVGSWAVIVRDKEFVVPGAVGTQYGDIAHLGFANATGHVLAYGGSCQVSELKVLLDGCRQLGLNCINLGGCSRGQDLSVAEPPDGYWSFIGCGATGSEAFANAVSNCEARSGCKCGVPRILTRVNNKLIKKPIGFDLLGAHLASSLPHQYLDRSCDELTEMEMPAVTQNIHAWRDDVARGVDTFEIIPMKQRAKAKGSAQTEVNRQIGNTATAKADDETRRMEQEAVQQQADAENNRKNAAMDAQIQELKNNANAALSDGRRATADRYLNEIALMQIKRGDIAEARILFKQIRSHCGERASEAGCLSVCVKQQALAGDIEGAVAAAKSDIPYERQSTVLATTAEKLIESGNRAGAEYVVDAIPDTRRREYTLNKLGL